MKKSVKLVSFFVAAGFCALALGLVAAPGGGSPAPAEGPAYMGGSKCKKCHIKQYKTWKVTKHAKAFSCIDAEHQKDPECIKCHTTGYGKGGFVDTDKTPQFENVQCEQCHGPGGNHIPLMTKLRKDKVDKAKYPKDKKINKKPTGCTNCHNPHKKHAPVTKKQ